MIRSEIQRACLCVYPACTFRKANEGLVAISDEETSPISVQQMAYGKILLIIRRIKHILLMLLIIKDNLVIFFSPKYLFHSEIQFRSPDCVLKDNLSSL